MKCVLLDCVVFTYLLFYTLPILVVDNQFVVVWHMPISLDLFYTWVSSEIRVLTPPENLSHTLDLRKNREGTLRLLPTVVVASLSHLASSFVHRTMNVMRGVARIRLRQLRLVLVVCR